MNCEYREKIVDYLENNLNDKEKEKFELYVKNNKDFRILVEDLKFQSQLIKKLPKVNTSSDFIINLNNQIDSYESKKSYSLFKIFTMNKSQINIPLLGTLSLIVIISFSLLKLSINDFSSYAFKNNQYDDSIAINDSDSLKNIYNDSPILLIGNEK